MIEETKIFREKIKNIINKVSELLNEEEPGSVSWEKFLVSMEDLRGYLNETRIKKKSEQSEDDQEPSEPVRHSALAELCINIGEGQAVVSPDGKIEFHDTGLNISPQDLQFVVQEAEAYIKYMKERNAQTQAH